MDEPFETSQDGRTAGTDDEFAFVRSIARIACWDNPMSAPRITEIGPAPTGEFIDTLSASIDEQVKRLGGRIPYTVIREVSENYIHARFTEMTVSILDGGDTIRFADQGPGITCKDRAQLPGFTTATRPMKEHIRGVGSGLPLVREFLEFNHGAITIEDNLGTGAVVTVSFRTGDADEIEDTNSDQQDLDATLTAEGNEFAGGWGMTGDWGTPTATTSTHTWGYAQPSADGQPFGAAGQPGQATQVTYSPTAPAITDEPAYGALTPEVQAAVETLIASGALGTASTRAPTQVPASHQGQPAWSSALQGTRPTSGLPGATASRNASAPWPANPAASPQAVLLGLTDRERQVLALFQPQEPLRVTDLVNYGFSKSTASNCLDTLAAKGLVLKMANSSRTLTEFGFSVASLLHASDGSGARR